MRFFFAEIRAAIEPFSDVFNEAARTDGAEGQGPVQAGGDSSTIEGFARVWGWVDAVVDIAHIINDKWDAVWDMPYASFLTLLRYRRDKAEYEAASAREQRRLAKQRQNY